MPISTPKFVFVSGYHDFRSRRRANLHFIADELKKQGPVLFLSVRFSQLNKLQNDPRADLRPVANRFEERNGVACYLWETLLHPISLPAFLAPLERWTYRTYASRLPKHVKDAVSKAEIVFVESGIGLLLLPVIREVNSSARIIYMASDSLATVNQSRTIRKALETHSNLLDGARLPSPYLLPEMPDGLKSYYIPHGIEKEVFGAIGTSPYEDGTRNAVSVGSMLFDRTFFEIAAARFPDVTFHVIGGGLDVPARPNIVAHGEMPFAETLPYIRHATFAIAPYQADVPSYLTHTSMKLMQYGFLGVPTVCPVRVVGQGLGRFGYEPGSESSIVSAIEDALAAGRVPVQAALDWREVTTRLIEPERFADTRIAV